jgi:hypothetical protein
MSQHDGICVENTTVPGIRLGACAYGKMTTIRSQTTSTTGSMDHITCIALALFVFLAANGSVCAISIDASGRPHNDRVALLSRRSLLCNGIGMATASTAAVRSSGAVTDTSVAQANDPRPFQTFQVEADASLALGPKLASIDVRFTVHQFLDGQLRQFRLMH